MTSIINMLVFSQNPVQGTMPQKAHFSLCPEPEAVQLRLTRTQLVQGLLGKRSPGEALDSLLVNIC